MAFFQFYKGNNFSFVCLFPLMDKAILKEGQLLKERICSYWKIIHDGLRETALESTYDINAGV